MKILDPLLDREEWDAVASRSGKPDVHSLSAYARAQLANPVRMLVGTEWFQVVSYPEQQPRHFSSLFQYGGPQGVRIESEMRMFAESLSAIAEYGCVLGKSYPVGAIDLGSKPVVVMDLPTLCEQDVSRRIRRGLHASAAAGAAFGRCMPAVFGELYAASMARKCAAKHWDMSHGQISAYVDAGAQFFYCGSESVGQRALLTVGIGDWAYAHFLGSDGDGQRCGLDETIYFRAAQSLAREGFKWLHLGGGLTDNPDDSLLAFKLGLGGVYDGAQRYGVIFDEARYATLVSEKAAAEIAERGRVSIAKWFPGYARPFK